MANCTSIVTPVDTKPKASAANGKLIDDATTYWSIADAL